MLLCRPWQTLAVTVHLLLILIMVVFLTFVVLLLATTLNAIVFPGLFLKSGVWGSGVRTRSKSAGTSAVLGRSWHELEPRETTPPSLRSAFLLPRLQQVRLSDTGPRSEKMLTHVGYPA